MQASRNIPVEQRRAPSLDSLSSGMFKDALTSLTMICSCVSLSMLDGSPTGNLNAQRACMIGHTSQLRSLNCYTEVLANLWACVARIQRFTPPGMCNSVDSIRHAWGPHQLARNKQCCVSVTRVYYSNDPRHNRKLHRLNMPLYFLSFVV